MQSGLPGVRSATLYADGPRVIVIDSGHFPAGHSLDAVLLVRRDFSCGAGCTFLHPIYVEGDCEIGKGSRAAAVFAGGRLLLAPSAEVRTWTESNGEMELRPGSRVRGVALSRTAIQVGPRCEIGCISAPDIRTQAAVPDCETRCAESGPVMEIPPPGNDLRLPRRPIPGLDVRRLKAIGAETWFYNGNLILAERVLLRAHLVTQGCFTCPPGSLLEGDVRADGALYVGQRSLVRGRLTANGDMVLKPGSIFQESLHGRQGVRLCYGVRGFQSHGPVSVVAEGSLIMEDRVVIRGRVSSSDRVSTDILEHSEPADWTRASGW